MTTYDEMRAFWEAVGKTCERFGALVIGATVANQVVAHLDDVKRSEADTVLTLKQAAVYSGYTVDHLSRLIRQGRIPNVGRIHAPRIKLGDLPIRRPFAKNRERSYSVETDARSLLSRRGDRHHDASNSKAK